MSSLLRYQSGILETLNRVLLRVIPGGPKGREGILSLASPVLDPLPLRPSGAPAGDDT
jgi:hypothetical protein